MLFCKDCKYYRFPDSCHNHLCMPGNVEYRPISAKLARNGGYCGMEAKYFEAKDWYTSDDLTKGTNEFTCKPGSKVKMIIYPPGPGGGSSSTQGKGERHE